MYVFISTDVSSCHFALLGVNDRSKIYSGEKGKIDHPIKQSHYMYSYQDSVIQPLKVFLWE